MRHNPRRMSMAIRCAIMALGTPMCPRPRKETMLRFFFSSRRRHTRLQGDWSSDVCSSDLHQHGVLQNGLTYEIIRPEEVGVARSSLVLGKHSGRHALERRYRELGYEVDDATLRKLYDEFTTLADKKREILDEDLLTLLHGRFHDAPEAYRLAHLQVTCGTVSATAEVRLAGPWNGKERGATAVGNGPIAATFAAIAKVVERQVDVLNPAGQSGTPGRHSLGQALVQARIDR